MDVVVRFHRGDSMSDIPSRDYAGIAWDQAIRAIKREPHDEWEMRSADSKGPDWVWVCDRCRTFTRSYASRPIPTCSGGKPNPFAR